MSHKRIEAVMDRAPRFSMRDTYIVYRILLRIQQQAQRAWSLDDYQQHDSLVTLCCKLEYRIFGDGADAFIDDEIASRQ